MSDDPMISVIADNAETEEDKLEELEHAQLETLGDSLKMEGTLLEELRSHRDELAGHNAQFAQLNDRYGELIERHLAAIAHDEAIEQEADPLVETKPKKNDFPLGY